MKRYFETHSNDFGHNIVWIDASDLEESFKQLAQILNLTLVDQKGTSKPISLVIDEVHQYFWEDQTLFVFDNFISQTSSSKAKSTKTSKSLSNPLNYLPTYKESISIITAQKEVSSQCLINIKLDSLLPKSALNYVAESLTLLPNSKQGSSSQQNLTNQTLSSTNEIPQILEKLGYHPLAIQQFITYSQETKCHPSYYLDLLEKNPEALLKDEVEQSGIIDNIKITITKIQELSNQLPYQLLQMGTFLNGKEIERGFFVQFFNQNEDKEDPDSTSHVNAALSILERFSLISIWESTSGDCHQDVITIHSLVQQTMSIILKTENTFEVIFHSILAKIYQHSAKCEDDITFVDKLGYKYFYKQLIYFANSDNEHSRDLFLSISEEHSSSIFNIFHNCQKPVIGQQILTKIERYIEQNIEKLRESPLTYCCVQPKSNINSQCILLYKVQSCIARIYYQKRNFFGAYLIFGSVRKKQRLLLGNQHKDFLLSTLGYVSCLTTVKDTSYEPEDDLEMAKKLYKIIRRVFGKEHPHTLLTRREIGIKYSGLGDHVSSLEILFETLEAQIRIHGESHVEVFATRMKIALRQIGKRIRPLQSLLDDMLQSLPESNDLVLRTQYYIGREYLTRGRYTEALEIFDVVYNGWLILYGDSYSDVREIESFIFYLKSNQI